VIPEVPNRHDPRIEELAGAASATNSTKTGFNSVPGALSNSWNRCLVDYHVDPKSGTAPNVVTQTELKASKEPVRDLIEQAREEIDRLYASGTAFPGNDAFLEVVGRKIEIQRPVARNGTAIGLDVEVAHQSEAWVINCGAHILTAGKHRGSA
jgi:hypothetical protein